MFSSKLKVENHLCKNTYRKFEGFTNEKDVIFNDDEIYSFRFIGEEGSSLGNKVELTDAPTWIIDPIDGTMNFVHGLPHTCISIALLINKTAEIGIVYNPILEQLFTACRGQGAFLNGAPIQVSGEKGD